MNTEKLRLPSGEEFRPVRGSAVKIEHLKCPNCASEFTAVVVRGSVYTDDCPVCKFHEKILVAMGFEKKMIMAV